VPWAVSALTLAADQASKQLVMAAFAPGESLPLVPGILHLTYVRNTGAAFGLFQGQHVLFIGISILVIGWVVRELSARGAALAAPVRWSYALILGGATGNLIDRLRFGHVVDFLDLRVWPVFNVADSAITIGVTLLVWHALRKRQHDG
jgi:signal peptidase II